MKIEDISNYLKEHRVKPSFQRVEIFNYLIKYRNHPTVDMIYKDLVNKIPTLSKTTVYNTLKLFIEEKIVMIVNIEDIETRYDADTSIHGHFKCENCGAIYDFNADISLDNIEEIKDFKINETHIYLKGSCNKC